MGGYLRHIELSKQLEQKAKEASQNRELAEQRLAELEQLLDGAKKADCNVSEAEELLAQASSAVGAKDYRLALEKVQDAEDKAKAAFLQRTQSILDSAEGMLELLKRTGKDTAEYEALIGGAKDALEKGSYEEAVESAKRGWIKAEKLLQKYLSDSFSSAQNLILAAQAMEKETGMAEDLLKRAREALESSDYPEALSQTEEALELLGRELDFEIEEQMKKAVQLLEAGQAFKADVSKARDYLRRSEKELERADVKKAHNLLRQAATEAERQLKKAIESKEGSLKGPIDEAKELGADTTKAEALAQDAMAAADKDDFSTAADLIRKALSDLEEAKFQGVLQTISLTRPKFLKARELGANVQGAMDLLNQARESLQKGNFKQALRHTERGTEELDKLVLQFSDARERMEALLEEVRFFVDEGIELPAMDNLLPAADEELSKGDLQSWKALVGKIDKELDGTRKKRSKQLLEEAKFLLELAEKTGLSLVEEQEVLAEHQASLKTGDTAKALQESLALKARLEQKLAPHIEGRIEDVRTMLPEESLGDILETLNRAATALEILDFDTAATFLSDAEARAQETAKDLAATIIEGLAAAQHLSTEHEIDSYGLREAHLAAKTALEDGDIPAVFTEVETVADQLTNLASEAFAKVKDRVIETRNSGIRIDDLKAYLRQAKDAITGGDLVVGLIHLRDCDLDAKDILDSYQKVHDVMASAAVIVAEGKKKDVNMSRAIELMVKGKTAFESGDIRKALEYAEDARSEAEKELSVLNVTDKIMAAKESLELAKMVEVDVRLWENLLKRARQSLDAKDFREAVELAMEAEDQAKAGIRQTISTQVAKAASLMDEVRVPAREVGELQAQIDQVKALLEGGQLREAADSVPKALEGCEQLAKAYRKTLGTLKSAENLVSELQSMNVRVSGPEKLLNKARKAFEDGNLTHGGQLAEEAHGQLEGQREESIKRTISGFEAVVTQAKAGGIDATQAEELLKEAYGLAEERKFQDALAAAMKAEAIVEKMGLQKEIAENALETARSNISALPSSHPDLLKGLQAAEAAFEKGDYIGSLEAAIAVRDEFTVVRDAWEVLEAAEETALKFYRMGERVGVDASRWNTLLEEGKAASEKGDLTAAKQAYDALATQAAGDTAAWVTQVHTEVKNALIVANLIDADVEGVEDRLNEARGYADGDRFEEAHGLFVQAKGQVAGALKAKIDELLANSQEAIAHAAKVGVDPSEAKQMVADAQAAMAEGQFEKAVRLAQESAELLKGKEEVERRFMGASFKAESLIKTAKKFGIDVKKPEKALKKAQDLKDSDPEAAIAAAQDILGTVEESLKAFTPAISLALEVKEPAKEEWSDAVLTLKNTGKAVAKEVALEVLGDLEVQGLEVPKSVRAKGKAEAKLQIRFNVPGPTPVMVKVQAKPVLGENPYEWEQVFEIDVGVGKPKQGSRAIVAEFETKCRLCRGSIKKGFSARECECGAMLHEPCALRAGKCPACERGL